MAQLCNYYFAPKNTPPGFLLVMSDDPGFCNSYQRSLTGYDADPRFKRCCGGEPVLRVGGCFEWCAMAEHYKPINNTYIHDHHPEQLFQNCLNENASTPTQKWATQAMSCFMPKYKSQGGSLLASSNQPVGMLVIAMLVAVLFAAI